MNCEMESLESLNLLGNKLLEVQVGENLPNISHLNISNNFNLSDTSFLKSFPKLTNLEANRNLGFENLNETLNSMTCLKSLSITQCLKWRGSLGQPILKNLEFLDITDCGFSIKVMFNNGIDTFSNITRLNMDNYLCITDCEFIGNGLALRNLKHLSINRCKSWWDFEKMLLGPNMSNLETLSLESCHIGIQGCKLIAQSSTLTRLTKLNLSNNLIKDEGCAILCQSSNLQHLISLDISWNELTTCSHLANNQYFVNLIELKFENRVSGDNDPMNDKHLLETSPHLSKLKNYKQ
ncbi:predicted protein [Naegleria gruberi]|uniref:Predicted protein n=1 Tax=Naegleria gruberi TaxID=5762 RepID=D2W3H4_NAEGR|nr:uncharacterized protein NAEGRDRAFT_75945 [Naegleria gruberi]EFC36385.1 predicted protein [Naegleria gruberi]|eukprot:XP_002669129.1 predicted protein [Naegleria gruberi strain NEG-M]